VGAGAVFRSAIRDVYLPADFPWHSPALKRRKELYEAKHPETRKGGDRRSKDQVGPLKSGFAKDAARKSGKSATSIKRDAQRGKALGKDAERIGTGLGETVRRARQASVEAGEPGALRKTRP
jgi:hypothetical protein